MCVGKIEERKRRSVSGYSGEEKTVQICTKPDSFLSHREMAKRVNPSREDGKLGIAPEEPLDLSNQRGKKNR